MSDNRDRGIDFGDLPDDLEDESYPLSQDELLERYGDRELGHASGSTTVEEVLQEEDVDEYEDPDHVHESILNMVGGGAVGRKGYTDRGTTDTGTYEEDDTI